MEIRHTSFLGEKALNAYAEALQVLSEKLGVAVDLSSPDLRAAVLPGLWGHQIHILERVRQNRFRDLVLIYREQHVMAVAVQSLHDKQWHTRVYQPRRAADLVEMLASLVLRFRFKNSRATLVNAAHIPPLQKD